MPTYEYRCRDCGHSFDMVQKMSDEPLTHCPECGGHLRKVFTPPAISFKGSGFYATDQRNKKRTSADTKDKDGADTKGDAKKESSTSSDASASDTRKKSDTSTPSTKSTKEEGSS